MLIWPLAGKAKGVSLALHVNIILEVGFSDNCYQTGFVPSSLRYLRRL
jgi:hypothetical protein